MGKVMMSGIVPLLSTPVTAIRAGEIAVGASVYLRESGKAVEYLVVNQGIPSGSSLYDASCDGTWLMRKRVDVLKKWSSGGSGFINDKCTAFSYLAGDFFATLDESTQNTIQPVKIPYYTGLNVVSSGSEGWECRVFIPSYAELLGADTKYADGARLAYFEGAESGDERLIGWADGDQDANTYFTRTRLSSGGSYIRAIMDTGAVFSPSASETYGIRPTLIVPKTALFDEETLILKGAG